MFDFVKASYQKYLPANIHVLLEISHSLFDETYYLIDNTVAITIDGQVYQPFPFRIGRKSQGDNSDVSLFMSNITQIIASEVNKAKNNEPVIVKVKEVLLQKISSDIVYVTKDIGEFELVSPQFTKETVTASLILRNSLPFATGSRRFSNRNVFKNIRLR